MLDPQANSQYFLFNPQNTNNTTSYNTWQPINYSSRAKITSQNYKSWKSMGALRLNAAAEEEHSPSGVCSPPLWKTNNVNAIISPPSPDHFARNYNSLSPSSRKEDIARGQMEMMEMTRDMPESCYELSLKDLVERPKLADEDEASMDGLMKREEYQKANKKTKKKASVMRRSGSLDSGGFLLKMVFPISLRSYKSSKIVMVNKNEKNKIKSDSLERESVTESCGSSVISGSMKSSRGSSSSSSSSCSSRSSSRGKTNGWWSFIVWKKKRQD